MDCLLHIGNKAISPIVWWMNTLYIYLFLFFRPHLWHMVNFEHCCIMWIIIYLPFHLVWQLKISCLYVKNIKKIWNHYFSFVISPYPDYSYIIQKRFKNRKIFWQYIYLSSLKFYYVFPEKLILKLFHAWFIQIILFFLCNR